MLETLILVLLSETDQKKIVHSTLTFQIFKKQFLSKCQSVERKCTVYPWTQVILSKFLIRFLPVTSLGNINTPIVSYFFWWQDRAITRYCTYKLLEFQKTHVCVANRQEIDFKRLNIFELSEWRYEYSRLR